MAKQGWQQLRKFTDDDDFRAFLAGELKLPNADAIIQKLTLTAPGSGIPFAKGLKRLRYEAGAFYLEATSTPDVPIDAIGIGKHIDTNALQDRWQRMAPYIKVTVKLDKNMSTAIATREYVQGGVAGYHVRLNPNKLKGPKQVEERVKWVDAQLK